MEELNNANIQSEKAILIERLRQLNDIDLVRAIKNMLDYALKKENESCEVHEAHQELVMERFKKIRKDPDRLMDWDKAQSVFQLPPEEVVPFIG